jgi:ornithine--oxo-acid transaminase
MDTVKAKAAEFIELESRYGANNYHPLDVVVQKAEGVWVWDVEGKKYLDFLAAYSAVNQGHCHPKIRQAMVEQSGKVTLTSRAFRSDQLGLFYKEICDLSGYPKFLPMNSGAEAVETAIKIARKWGHKVKGIPDGKAEIVTFTGNFHGRTTTIVSFSDDAQYRDGFGPFTPGFPLVPYGDLEAAKAALNENTAAVLIEIMQGESGIIPPPPGFIKGLYEACRQRNILFIADEIQSGLGRTGKLFCFQHDGICPDMVIVGKALSGGFYPVSGVLAGNDVMGVLKPGDHGSTFGGNPLAAAVGRAALRVLVDEGMVENSAKMGDYFLARLRTVNDSRIQEVRGKGLWIGLELKPEAGGARRFCEALRDKGLLCKETHVHTIRFAPPLCIRKEELDWAFERIEEVFREVK